MGGPAPHSRDHEAPADLQLCARRRNPRQLSAFGIFIYGAACLVTFYGVKGMMVESAGRLPAGKGFIIFVNIFASAPRSFWILRDRLHRHSLLGRRQSAGIDRLVRGNAGGNMQTR